MVEGTFRKWLYVAARNHAIDEHRRVARRREVTRSFGVEGVAEPWSIPRDDTPFDADQLYALSILHLTINRVRKHLIEEGKHEHWMIFDELSLAPLTPDRVARTRHELTAMFPGQSPEFLNNRMTTVKRVFRRILAATLLHDPAESLTQEERIDELLEILCQSRQDRLWLVFLEDPVPEPGAPSDSSQDLSARWSRSEAPRPEVSPDAANDELQVLLAFWLEKPLHEYLEDVPTSVPVPADAARRRPDLAPPPLNLRRLVETDDLAIPPWDLASLLAKLKTFAKLVHRLVNPDTRAGEPRRAARRESSMPAEVAQVFYNLAGALALTRCGTQIVGISDDRFRKNLGWVLNQPWLDARLRPVFFAALKQLGPGTESPGR